MANLHLALVSAPNTVGLISTKCLNFNLMASPPSAVRHTRLHVQSRGQQHWFHLSLILLIPHWPEVTPFVFARDIQSHRDVCHETSEKCAEFWRKDLFSCFLRDKRSPFVEKASQRRVTEKVRVTTLKFSVETRLAIGDHLFCGFAPKVTGQNV